MINFSPNTTIKSADVNANFIGLGNGTLDTTNNSLVKTRKQSFANFVAIGASMNTSATLSSVLAAGEVYVNGQWVVVSLQTITFSGSKDTYLYVKDDGTIVQNAVANNAGSPSATLNSDSTQAFLLKKVVTSGSAVTAVVETGTDSNGVQIYSINPAGFNSSIPFVPNWTNLSVGTGGLAANEGWVLRYGKFAKGYTRTVFGTSGASIISSPYIAVPRAASANYNTDYNYVVGQTWITHTGVAEFVGRLTINSAGVGNTLQPLCEVTSGGYNQPSGLTSTIPFTFGAGDSITTQFEYELF